jgi:hypothetical protein
LAASADPAAIDGALLLDRLRAALCRYVVLPSAEAADAVVLWIAATHGQPAWEHATRLGITGPAKRCGKSRLLEVVKATAHNVLPAVHASTAALYRSIDSKDPPTLLFDEVDAIFGTRRAAEANEELRALINAGHSRGWPILRCVGPSQEVARFPSFAMAALAGIGDLPDTIADRAVNIRMRRRAPGESVRPFRTGRDTPALHALRGLANRWVRLHVEELRHAEPDLPVEDRAGDTWESLIAVADLAGQDWPERGRYAAKVLTAEAAEADAHNSDTLRLLADLRGVFADATRLHTTTILDALHGIEDAPWAGRALSAHDLSRMLRAYCIRSRDVREDGGPNRKGYHRADLADAFSRYLPPALVADVADLSRMPSRPATSSTSHVADVADVAAPPPNRAIRSAGPASTQPTVTEGGAR